MGKFTLTSFYQAETARVVEEFNAELLTEEVCITQAHVG
jgi:hypothetical protein